MGKLSSILLGTVSGAALALFLTSDKGKQVCSQAQDFLDDLREDPEYAKEQVCEKLTEVKAVSYTHLMWSLNKWEVLNSIEMEMRRRGSVQGCKAVKQEF